ncbi:tetratricopeptide repeat protein [bacterium]|nr:tetratricopeptide repeat protein [bacterium]
MSEERFKKMIAVLIAVVTLIAAVLAQLETEAGDRDDRANRDSKRASVEAFGLQIRGNTQANYHYYTAFEQYREMETLSEAAAKRKDTKASDRYADMRDRLLDTSPLLAGKDRKGKPYFDSENEWEPDLARFEADSYYVKVQNLLQNFKAASRVKDGWDYKANSYIFHLTLLAVSLFLFGLAATIATAGTRVVFTLSGLGITAAAVMAAAQVYLLPVPDLRTRTGAIEHYAEGMGLVHQELRKESIAEFDQAIAAAPEFADAYLERGRAYLYLESPELAKALDDFKKALELDPSNASLYTEMAWCQYLLGDFEESIKTCQLGLQDRSDSLQLQFQLALNQLAGGKEKEARETYQKALEGAASSVAEAAKNKQEAPSEIIANLDEGSRMLDDLAKVIEDKKGLPAPDKLKGKVADVAKACEELSNLLVSYELSLESSGKPPEGKLTAKLEVTGFQDTSGKTPKDPSDDDVFKGAPAQITLNFDFEGLKEGQKVVYRTFKDGEELESWRWEETWTKDAAGSGSWEEPLYPEYSESFRFEPGDYYVEIFVDYHLAAYGNFKVEE